MNDISPPRKSPAALWIGLTIAIILETVVQLLWKRAARDVSSSATFLDLVFQLLQNPLFQITIVLWIVQLFNWLLVLARSDLSFAQPMSAISYITVTGSAYFLFHEHISLTRAAGIVLIVMGAWQMGATEPHSRFASGEAPR